jgi:hypothetical protein
MKIIKTEKYGRFLTENNIEKDMEDFFKKIGPIDKWWAQNKPKEEIKDVFENIERITGFQIIQSNPRGGEFPHEPNDGTIRYNGKVYNFKFNSEFDDGNTYIVYDGDKPVFYFSLYDDFEGEVGSPMLLEPT